MGDHLWMSRYLLSRIAEDYNVNISFAPKLFADWNGSGCHCNYSTKTMRDGAKGMKYIDDMMVEFDKKHKTHIACYGEGNDMRLTGIHETSSCEKFSYGVANRAASFRIPSSTAQANGKGYIEDRRPASNIDPYIVGALIADTSLLTGDASKAAPMVAHYDAWTKWAKTAEIGRASCRERV